MSDKEHIQGLELCESFTFQVIEPILDQEQYSFPGAIHPGEQC